MRQPPVICISLSLSLSLSLSHTEGTDFVESERIVTFDNSYTTESDPECVTVPILEDDILEDRETFIMEFNMDDGELPTTVRCLIEDNDSESHQLAGNL